jgi:hypothetical protein
MRYAFEEPGTGGRQLLTVDESLTERRPYRDAGSPLLTIAWNRGPAQTVWVDGPPVRLPARYVIGQDGTILYAEVNPDYTRRPEPEEMLPVLQQAAAVGV